MASAGAGETGVKLPDIGSSAGELMSPQQQRDYGASMLYQMRAYDLILDDPLLVDYLNALGYRLVAHSDRADLLFTFFMVRDNGINAFAAPGGYIGVNAGMMIATQNEAELAAVIAHEIAHITQQHLLRAFEDTKKFSLPVALAMLGAIIATSNRSDDASQAALISGLSLIQQRQINFTREDEAEADRIGIQTLSRTGFNPVAMADTFTTLQRVMRINGVDVPEFLRTHPVDTNRIADAKARAEQLTRDVDQKQPAEPALSSQSASKNVGMSGLMWALPALSRPNSQATKPLADTIFYFELMRERARVLTAESANGIRTYYADGLHSSNTHFDTMANRYGYALALIRAGQPQQAIKELQEVAAKQPDSALLQLALAEAEEQAGQREAAWKRYLRLSENYPGNRAIALAYANSLLAHADKSSAQHAQELLRPLLATDSDDPALQRSFARACELAGDTIRAGEAYADVAYLSGQAEDALNQLKALSKRSDLDYYQRTRIDARIAELTPLVLELRRRAGYKGEADELVSLAK